MNLQGQTGLFASKGFPEDYPANSNCTWTITVPEDNKVQLTFHLLNVSLISFQMYQYSVYIFRSIVAIRHDITVAYHLNGFPAD